MDSSGPSVPPPLPPDIPPPQPPRIVPGRVERQAPARRPGFGWVWALLAVALVFGLGVVVLVGMAASKVKFGAGFVQARHGHGADLHETVIRESDSDEKVAVIDLDGVISGEYIPQIDCTLVELVRDQLERAAHDRVKAVLLKVDSPGGEVLASDEIHILLRDFQKTHDIPVVASMGSLAASGGYYVSAPCRWIVANELTITGSIGVIFHGYNYRGLMDKVGVRPEITKSGKLKDMMSGEKTPEEELPEERRILQGMIDESYAKFKAVVREGRRAAAEKNREQQVEDGRALASNWQDFADGRILSGSQALGLGLVDELGNFDAAVDRALSLAGIDEATLVSYRPPYRFPGLFSLLGGDSGARTIRIDLGLPFGAKLRQGRLYFMSPVHMH